MIEKEKSTPKRRINAATSKGIKITLAARNGPKGRDTGSNERNKECRPDSKGQIH